MSEEKGSSTVSDSCVDNLVLAQEIFGKNNIKWISSRNKFWTRNFIQKFTLLVQISFYIDTKIRKIRNALVNVKPQGRGGRHTQGDLSS